MRLRICTTYESMSHYAADLILEYVKNKPDAVLCFASGSTPQYCCQMLTQKAKEQGVDFSQITFLGLDEWVGIDPENEGSCHYFFQKNMIGPLGLTEAQVHLFDALSKDLQAECSKMDQFIASKGGLDIVVVGLGMNGHIGFNEPGIATDKYAHVAELEEITKSVGQKYFKGKTKLTKGITLGLKYLAEAKSVLMLANGQHKAEIVQKTLENEIDINLPATIMRKLPQGVLILDNEAASLLTLSKSPA